MHFNIGADYQKNHFNIRADYQQKHFNIRADYQQFISISMRISKDPLQYVCI
jgi:hypothetical protein